MISSYLAMQNAILAQNAASTQMVQASNRMLSSVSFGNSQPLKPSFAASSDSLELETKANETKVSFLKKLIDALNKKLGKDVEKSTPKYSGVDYKA